MSLRIALKRSLEDDDTVNNGAARRPPKSTAYIPSLRGKKYDDGTSSHPPVQSSGVVAPATSSRIVTPRRRRRGRIENDSPAAKVIELPPVTECIRNTKVTNMESTGFVEMKRVLPSHLVGLLRAEVEDKLSSLLSGQCDDDDDSYRRLKKKTKTAKNRDGDDGYNGGFVKISNSLQANVSHDLAEKVSKALLENKTLGAAMKVVFGKSCDGDDNDSTVANNAQDKKIVTESSSSSYYDGFVVERESLKLLATTPGSPPQLPHADDHCTSCLVGIVHLKDNQLQTRIAQYNPNKDYPTGITSTCDSCHVEEQLPDVDYKRGVHLTTQKWYCGNCQQPQQQSLSSSLSSTPYDFERKLTHSFGELLQDPNICNSYAGNTPKANDGILALPTLLHCGPGNPSTSTSHRIVFFFTLRPTYQHTKRLTSQIKELHRYNSDIQIHAPCVLYNMVQRTLRVYGDAGYGNLEYYSNNFIIGGDGRVNNAGVDGGAERNRLKVELERAKAKIERQEKQIERLMGRGDGKEMEEKTNDEEE